MKKGNMRSRTFDDPHCLLLLSPLFLYPLSRDKLDRARFRTYARVDDGAKGLMTDPSPLVFDPLFVTIRSVTSLPTRVVCRLAMFEKLGL
jgi:hypothetical protein